MAGKGDGKKQTDFVEVSALRDKLTELPDVDQETRTSGYCTDDLHIKKHNSKQPSRLRRTIQVSRVTHFRRTNLLLRSMQLDDYVG